MENGRISQKLSLKPKLSERRQFIHASNSPRSSPTTVSPETPKPPKDGNTYVFFGDRSLLFLGVIASILALSMALWSIHKNSDMSRRLSDLNSTVVDLIVKHKAAPVVEVGRRELDSKASKFARFKEERETKKKEKVFIDPLNTTVEDLSIYKQEQDRENAIMLERIRRESEENIRRMELASKEALAEGRRHTVSTKQLSERVGRLQVKPPSSTNIPYSDTGEKIIDGITQLGDKLIHSNTPKRVFVDDIDVDDLEKDLRLLTGR